MRFDPMADLRLHALLLRSGHALNTSPTRWLEEAVKQHHAQAGHEFPEIDLRRLWADLLEVEIVSTEWLIELEHARQPLKLMPSARETLATLASRHLSLGLLSNAQADTLPVLRRELGENPFSDDLCVLSYEHGIAKPAAGLFKLMIERLASRGIEPGAVVMVGNDPRHDVAPARAIGLNTVLLDTHSALPRQKADAVIQDLSELLELLA